MNYSKSKPRATNPSSPEFQRRFLQGLSRGGKRDESIISGKKSNDLLRAAGLIPQQKSH